MQKLVGKLWHASIGIPAGRYLFGPINQLMAMEPKFVIWKQSPAARVVFKDWAVIIKEESIEPTHVIELVRGSANYKGTLDASGKGAGGIWVSGAKEIVPTVLRVEWPQDTQDRLVTFANPNGDIKNSDLEMAAELLGLLVLEAVVPT